MRINFLLIIIFILNIRIRLKIFGAFSTPQKCLTGSTTQKNLFGIFRTFLSLHENISKRTSRISAQHKSFFNNLVKFEFLQSDTYFRKGYKCTGIWTLTLFFKIIWRFSITSYDKKGNMADPSNPKIMKYFGRDTRKVFLQDKIKFWK